MMTEVLKSGYEERDIKKVLRLGKIVGGVRVRPLVLQFGDERIKNVTIENATRLSKAERKF